MTSAEAAASTSHGYPHAKHTVVELDHNGAAGLAADLAFATGWTIVSRPISDTSARKHIATVAVPIADCPKRSRLRLWLFSLGVFDRCLVERAVEPPRDAIVVRVADTSFIKEATLLDFADPADERLGRAWWPHGWAIEVYERRDNREVLLTRATAVRLEGKFDYWPKAAAVTENRAPSFGPNGVRFPTPQVSLTRILLAELSGLDMTSDWRKGAKSDPHRTLDEAELHLQDPDNDLANTAHNVVSGAMNDVANQTRKTGDVWEALQIRAATIAARIHGSESRREVRSRIHTNLMAFMRPADIEAQLIAFVRALADSGDPAHAWMNSEELNQSRRYFKFMSGPLPDGLLTLVASAESRLPRSTLEVIRELSSASSRK